MKTTPTQLAFDMPHRPALGHEDFLVSQSNAAAVALVDRWPDWPHPAAVIVGPAGSGKSHLANVWRAKSAAAVSKASALTRENLTTLAHNGSALVIEDLDDGPLDEQALFHLLNLTRENAVAVLFTSAISPGDMDIALPDFRSRLKALPLAVIDAPDDALLSNVLVKLFADRQLAVDPPIISYMLVRMERSMESARRLVAEIDRLGLAMQRGVTRTVAAAALDRLYPPAGSPE